MPDLVIADTSCFILLSKTGHFFVLKALYGTVITTPEVALEFGSPLPDFIQIEATQSAQLFTQLRAQVGAGEASAVALGLEKPAPILIIDDLKARKLAVSLGLKITGTLGVLLKAKQAGIISELKPVLTQIQETNFRLSPTLLKKFLTLAGEAF